MEIKIKDYGNSRYVEIKGKHRTFGGVFEESQFKTFLSRELLERILSVKKDYFKDEVDRIENPDYIEKPLAQLLNRFSIDLKDKAVLDFGCGAGASSIILAKLGATKIIGVDINDDLIAIARLRARDYNFSNRIEFYCSPDSGEFPFADNTFDVVLLNAVLEHIIPGERGLFLEKLWCLLSPGGYLLIQETPNRFWPIDFHTTGLLFLPYLPLSLARKYAVLFGKVNPKESIKDLLAGGLRGVTYWEIINPLKNKGLVEMNKVVSDDIESYFSLSLSRKDSGMRKIAKRVLRLLYGIIDTLLFKPLKLPVCAFLPSLNICLKKEV